MIPSIFRSSLAAIAAASAIAFAIVPPASRMPTTPRRPTQSLPLQRGALHDVPLGCDAPVTVEYYSPTCPHCGSFHENTFPQLKSEYIDTARFASSPARSISTRLVSLLASSPAATEQTSTTGSLISSSLPCTSGACETPPTSPQRRCPRGASQCLNDRAIYLVDHQRTQTDTHKIESTPTIIGNQTVRGAVPFDEIASVIEKVLP